MFKKILEFKLSVIARLILRRYKPMIIGVTGNVGKTTTKEAIATVVRKIHTVRVNAGNLNNELGLPMTIIGDWAEEYYREGASLGLWFRVLLSGWRTFLFKSDYPEVLVLEYGADHPGDINKLTKKYKPHISVITAVGDIPVHVEYFGSKEAIAKEKAGLISCLTVTDFAALNHDDEAVIIMQNQTKAKIKSFGFSQESGLRIANYGYNYSDSGKLLGVKFDISENEKGVTVEIGESLGQSVALSTAAASSVGRILGMDIAHIKEAMADFVGQPGRLRLLDGIKGTQIIDDSYNASPASMKLALSVLKEIKANRKIAVLGDMLELGEYAELAHRTMGEIAGEFCDILVCVGSRAKFIAESADNLIPKDAIMIFDNSNDAKTKVQEIIREGDAVLIKGSQGMRMEKIVEEIMANPENKHKLLVRQSTRWLEK
jgi:UDP-N-acetylmuramoyl-tripeptide--D-alanyl-D-alanine ligase